ncbi:MAG: hypothetical protein CMP47_13845 [Rickettsiales bacterium]|nr:hypothetical protein [Rickettsiales bacterium]
MMYKVKFRHKLKLALHRYKRAVILVIAFLAVSASITAIFGSSQFMGISGLSGIDFKSLIIGIGGFVVICILVCLD